MAVKRNNNARSSAENQQRPSCTRQPERTRCCVSCNTITGTFYSMGVAHVTDSGETDTPQAKRGEKLPLSLPLLALPTLSTSSSRLGRLLLEQCSHVVRAAGDVRYLSPRQRHHLLRLIPRLRLSAGAAPEAVRAARPDCIQRPRVFVFFRAKGERAEKEAREKEERRRINITWEAFAFRSKRRRGGGIGEGEHAKLCPHGLSGSISVLNIARPFGLQQRKLAKSSTNTLPSPDIIERTHERYRY